MMRVASRRKTVKGRLLALLALIMLPIIALSVISAITTYRTVSQSIVDSRLQTASDFAVRARVWFRGMSRTLVATVAGVDAAGTSAASCRDVAEKALDRNTGVRGFLFRRSDGLSCAATRGDVAERDLDLVRAEQAQLAPIRLWVGQDLAEMRYDSAVIRGTANVVVYGRNTDDSGRTWEALFLIDTKLIDQAFDLGVNDVARRIALVKKGGLPLAIQGAQRDDLQWMPAQEVIPSGLSLWRAKSRAGNDYAYAAQMVAEPDLYVLAKFDGAVETAARLQFIVLIATPALTLVILFLAYVRFVQRDVVQWITGIERAARARTRDGKSDVRAPIEASMPEDVRSVAESLNALIEAVDRREAELREALDGNRFLMRELHHHVKNNLQVIQSYLALSRRQRDDRSPAMSEAEAKVQVLSSAYRLALTDIGMRPVPIRAFTTGVVDHLASSLPRATQSVTADIDVEGGLTVDKVIPLGLAIVEGVSAALRAAETTHVAVQLDAPDGWFELRIKSDGASESSAASRRILAGLASQLVADAQTPGDGDILRWRFSA